MYNYFHLVTYPQASGGVAAAQDSPETSICMCHDSRFNPASQPATCFHFQHSHKGAGPTAQGGPAHILYIGFTTIPISSHFLRKCRHELAVPLLKACILHPLYRYYTWIVQVFPLSPSSSTHAGMKRPCHCSRRPWISAISCCIPITPRRSSRSYLG